MASMAASLMWRGVAKCGSPAPKLTRLTPCARRRAASAVTAMVAETSMRPMRSEKVLLAAVLVAVMLLFFQIFSGSGRNSFCGSSTAMLAQPLDDELRDEAFDGAAQLEDFLDEARAYEGVLAVGHEEDGFEFRGEAAVHERHLQFVLVIADGADAAQ